MPRVPSSSAIVAITISEQDTFSKSNVCLFVIDLQAVGMHILYLWYLPRKKKSYCLPWNIVEGNRCAAIELPGCFALLWDRHLMLRRFMNMPRDLLYGL